MAYDPQKALGFVNDTIGGINQKANAAFGNSQTSSQLNATGKKNTPLASKIAPGQGYSAQNYPGVNTNAVAQAGQSDSNAMSPNYKPLNSGNAGSGRMTDAPFGWDLNSPSSAEQYWHYNQNRFQESPFGDWVDQNAAQLQGQTAGEKGLAGVAGRMGNATAGEKGLVGTAAAFGNPGEANQFWNSVQGQFNQKTSDLTPEFDAFYDRAKEKSLSSMNGQLGARGAYGSSVGVGQLGQTTADIEAARAGASTDFMFKNQDNQRNWFDTFGGLANNAGVEDINRLTGQSNSYNQLGTLGNNRRSDQANAYNNLAGNEINRENNFANIMNNVGQEDYQRLMGGMAGALSSSNAFMGRQQMYSDDMFRNLALQLPFVTGANEAGIAGVEDNFGSAANAGAGGTASGSNAAQNEQNNNRDMFRDAYGYYRDFSNDQKQQSSADPYQGGYQGRSG